MEKDALLLIGAFLLAFITLNWSDMKLIAAKIKACFSKEKDEENTSS